MAKRNTGELFTNDRYIYNTRKSPAGNYILFQQAINFSNGVEFLSSSNESINPVIYLLKFPGLAIDLQKAALQLENFNIDLINQLKSIFNDEQAFSNKHGLFYEVKTACIKQQEEYNLDQEEFFGIVNIRELPIKEIKELKLPIKKSIYRGTFLNIDDIKIIPLEFKSLGWEAKNIIQSLYILKKRSNKHLLNKLNALESSFFQKKNIGTAFYYDGDIADIVELGKAVWATGKVTSVNGDENELCKVLCEIFGVEYSRLSNYKSTITSRLARNETFLKQLLENLKQKEGFSDLND